MTVQLSTSPDLARPDLTRPGVGIVKVSTWHVGTPERQNAAVEAIARAWRRRDWPQVGLLSYSVCTSDDGTALLHYSQWTGEDACQEFLRTFRSERNDEIDAAVPGIERLGLRTYERCRSGEATSGDTRIPGCVVIVEIDFDGADPARQRDWVDAVFAALESDPRPHPGGIAAHFHVSTDGTRVLNYAEWESAEAHQEALEAPGDGVGSRTEQWERVQHYPGLTGSRVTRYTPALSISAGV
ncbi:antibiotic biosynthesis monooxygenase [Streptomyces formicae]|uniref:Antibiotic biosynthesis monooxygenase n=1 Tax=Streptomyces formicae TaxID=1616117 RepID=A0ABY3WV69_9ACTN|nr:antibiotic biosynthesis monooxygenase [Streptomyces formicae]UNM14376.1 antibiotic biosynthesis monooxygenase [Streptomyces formicae]